MRLIDADNINRITLEDSCHVLTYEKGGEIVCEIDAPTVNQWIPCKVQMPPVGKTVLVTVKTDNDTWTDCDTWYQGDWMAYMGKGREVIAWCELPEPYKETDNERQINQGYRA